jgi:lipopolysaccharide assembly outer membrane protein LptD (OstA)
MNEFIKFIIFTSFFASTTFILDKTNITSFFLNAFNTYNRFFTILNEIINQKMQTSDTATIIEEFNKSEELKEQIKKLKGNCRFKQDNVFMYCDSALLYEVLNKVDAFGKVRIQQGDSLNLYGDLMNYDGNSKIARFKNNVRVYHNEMVLTTNVLDYDTKNRVAIYPKGGKIVDKDNILTSELGYYYANTADAFFKKYVVLTNPKYVLNSDTLKYNTKSRIATFFGPTTIVSKEDYLYAEAGTYNTVTDIAQFTKNPLYRSGAQTLTGDFLYYDRTRG